MGATALTPPRPLVAVLVLGIVVTVLIVALALMARHHNQGAGLRTPPKGSSGPG